MQQKTITATPGTQGYILVRAIKTDASGNITYSDYISLPYTVPSSSASGGNILTVNTSGDVQLSGGSLYAASSTNPFPTNVGLIDLTLVSPAVGTGSGVIINQTGIGAYKSGVQQFFLNAKTGQATFSGNVTAGSVKIGPGADPTGTKNGIYINDYNYWYEDGTWSATASNIQGALVSSKILKPSAVSNFLASWVGTTLHLHWTFDTNAVVANTTSNQNTKDFLLSLTAGGVTKTIVVQAVKSSAADNQSYDLTTTLNKSFFGVPQTAFTAISVAAEDTFGNIGPSASPTSIPTYTSPLSVYTPVLATTNINNGYQVTASPSSVFSDPSFQAMQVAESITSQTVYSSSNFNIVYSGTLNPVNILTTNLNQRWVSINFVDILGGQTSWSSVATADPISPVTINTNAPKDVLAATGSFIVDDINLAVTVYNISGITAVVTSGTTIKYTSITPHGFLSGDQVQVTGLSISTYNITGAVTVIDSNNFTIDGGSGTGTATGGTAQYAGISYYVKLNYTSGTINKNGYFSLNQDGTGNISQSLLITASTFYSQFGDNYSPISGTIYTLNASGIRSSGFSITSFSRPNPLTTAPNPVVTAVVDGYVVSYSNSSVAVAYAEVYEYFQDPAMMLSSMATADLHDYMTATYLSGGGLGVSTITLNNWIASTAGMTIYMNPAHCMGQAMNGTNLAPNTFVTNINPIPAAWVTTATSGSGSIAYVTSAAHGFTAGQSVTVSGLATPTLNVTGIVSATGLSSTGFTLTVSGMTAGTSTTADVGYAALSSAATSTYQYVVTLSNPMTGVPSGNYTMIGLVTTGSSPLTVFTTNYLQRWPVVIYYDKFQNNSPFGQPSPAYITPINPSTSLINSAVQVSSTGSIYLGSTNTSIPNVILGTTSNEAGMFIWGPNDGGLATPLTASITAVSGTGAVTFTTSAAHGFKVGQYVTISGITGGTTTYNNATPTQITAVSTTTTFTTSNTGTGTPSSFTGSLATVSPSTYNGVASTQIIGAPASPYTFVTKNAQIADWSITGSHIQNDLTTGTFSKGYVGLSGSNANYSIWAGSGTSDNSDGTAKFSVTPGGNVQARQITIIGSGTLGVTANATPFPPITSAVQNGTVATYTTVAAHGLTTGQAVNIAGFTAQTTFNATRGVVTVTGTNTFTIPNVNAASTATVLGYIYSVVPVLTTASITTNVATYNTSVAHGLVAGNTVNIAGYTTTQFNVVPNTAVVTAASATGTTTVSYTAVNTFVAGQTVTVSGLTITTGSSLNLTGVVSATGLSGTAFNLTVPTAVTGTAAATQAGVATVESVIQSTPTTTSFTLKNYNANATATGTGYVVASTPTFTATLTYTTGAVHNLIPGQYITISGITATAYNQSNQAIPYVPSTTTLGFSTPAFPAIIGAVLNGTIAIYTTATSHGLATGNTITTQGFANTNFNVTNLAITAINATSFSVANTATAANAAATGMGYISAVGATGGSLISNLMTAGGLFSVTSDGTLKATGATIDGAITARSGTIYGNLALGGSLYSNSIKAAPITAVTPNATTGVLYTSTGHTFVVGDVVSISGVAPYQYSGIFTVTAVTAGVSFTIGANLNTVAVTTATGSAVSTGTQSFILNNSGLIFNSPTTQGVTTINGATGLLTTSSANIGGWLISDTTGISKTTGSGTIKLDATNGYVSASSTTYSSGLSAPSANASTDVVFWAGSAGAKSTANSFYVTAVGALFANNATISGNVTANSIVANASITSPVITSGLANASTPTSAGFYLSAGSTPSLLISNGTSYLQYSAGSLNVVGGSINGGTINGSLFTSNYLGTGSGLAINYSSSNQINFSYNGVLSGQIYSYIVNGSGGVVINSGTDSVTIGNGGGFIGNSSGGFSTLSGASVISGGTGSIQVSSSQVVVTNSSSIAAYGIRNIAAYSGSNPLSGSPATYPGLIVLVY